MNDSSSTTFVHSLDCECKQAMNVDYNRMSVKDCSQQDHVEKENKSYCECFDPNIHGYRDLVAQSHAVLELIPTLTTIVKDEDQLFHNHGNYAFVKIVGSK